MDKKDKFIQGYKEKAIKMGINPDEMMEKFKMWKEEFDNKKIDKIVKKLVEEGREVGKTPWSCDLFIEQRAFGILNAEGDYPQETMEETCKRREEENLKGVVK